MHVNKHTKGWAVLFFSPFLIAFVFFWIIPLVYGVFTSLHQYSTFAGNQGFVGLANYQQLLFGEGLWKTRFLQGMTNTIQFTFISFIPLVFIALGLALLLDQLKGWLKVMFRTIFFISYGVSVTAVSAIFKWLFNGNGGYVNNLLANINIPAIQWLNTQPYAWAVIVVTTVWWTIGYNMILFVNALDDVDHSMLEAAELDGANAFEKFYYITLPAIKNVMAFVTLTTIIATFNLYGQSLLITGGGPSQSTNSIIMIIQQTIFAQKNLGMGSAMAILLGIVMMVISALQFVFGLREEKVS